MFLSKVFFVVLPLALQINYTCCEFSHEDKFIGSSGLFFQPLENVFVHDSNYIIVQKLLKPPNLQSVQTVNVNNRQKRFLDHGILPFVGWITQKLIGVATTSDLDDIKVQSRKLSEYVNNLKKLTQFNSLGIKELMSDITTIRKKYDINQEELHSALKGMINFNKMIANEEQYLKENIKELATYLKSSVTYLKHLQSYDFYWLDYQLGLSICRNELLPENFIPKETLLQNLTDIENILRGTPFELSIQKEKIDWYYIFNIVFCREEDDGVLILTSIPLSRKLQSPSRIEKMIPVPIRINNETVALSGLSPSLVISNSQTISIIKSVQKNCLSENELDLSNCLIKLRETEVFPEESCLNKIHLGSSIKEYKKLCKLSSVSHEGTSWIQLNNTHWIYTGPETTIKINCFGVTNATELVIGGQHNSNIMSIPCNCWTQNGLVYSPPSFATCKNLKSIINYRIHSYHYIKYDELKLTPYKLESSFEFTSDFLNSSEKLNIHNYSSDVIKLEHLLTNIDKPVPVIEWTSPYHSNWTYLSLIILIIITCLILIYCLKHNRNLLCGYGLLSRLPQVKAEGVPEWVEITYDLFLFLIILGGIIILTIYVRRILTRLSCHHIRTKSLKNNEGPHCDLILVDGANCLSIGLKRLPNLGHLYLDSLNKGTASANNGYLEVAGFHELEDVSGARISINGTYPIDKNFNLSSCQAIVKVQSILN